MLPVQLSNATWPLTFPRFVTPLYDEWFAGLLLRCDEVNHWTSGTTWTFLRQIIPPMKPPLLPILSVPPLCLVEYIAQCLALPVQEVCDTTYLPELTRYYGFLHPLPGDLKPSLTFRVCPVCLAKERLLKRTLALMYVLCCPWHEVTLLSTCQCGTPLRLFDPVARPFCCGACGRDWAVLPKVAPTPERIAVTRQLLSCYEYFFFCGKPSLMEKAFHLMVDAWQDEIVRDRRFWNLRHAPPQSPYPHLASNQVPALCPLVFNLVKYHLYHEPKDAF